MLLAKFSYNNSHSRIGMAPFEALYGRPCRSPICCLEFGKVALLGLDIVQQTNEMVKTIKQQLETTQSLQKSYVAKRRRPLLFEEGGYVFLKVYEI